MISFNQIMKNIDDSDNVEEFNMWVDYLSFNRKKYPLNQLSFAAEFISDKRFVLKHCKEIVH